MHPTTVRWTNADAEIAAANAIDPLLQIAVSIAQRLNALILEILRGQDGMHAQLASYPPDVVVLVRFNAVRRGGAQLIDQPTTPRHEAVREALGRCALAVLQVGHLTFSHLGKPRSGGLA
ncbi:MAG: hypothetical protein F4048_05240 [Gammaproteobacteria bacterium]|nr:hypothetical protein [Gammaproteobacteria bacterium]